MNRLFWIFSVCVLSVSNAFSQDESFFQDSGKVEQSKTQIKGKVKSNPNTVEFDNQVYGSSTPANNSGSVFKNNNSTVSPDNEVYSNDNNAGSVNISKKSPVNNGNANYDNNAYDNDNPDNQTYGSNAATNSNNNTGVKINAGFNYSHTNSPDEQLYNNDSGANSNNGNNHISGNNSGYDANGGYNSNGVDPNITATVPNNTYSNTTDPGNASYANNNGPNVTGNSYASANNDASNNGNNDYNNYNGNDNSAEVGYSYDNDDDQSYQSFHDQLSPYGNWVNYPGYGNVWVPGQVPTDFSPYATGGHWVYANCGWTWSSDYAWGAIPFHYGRWFRDNAYGWMWVPGYQWAPAWVTWGSYDNYYCWAPLAPFVGFSAYYRPNPFCWNFVARNHFCEGNLGFYLANRGFYGRGDYRGLCAHIGIISESRTFGNRSFFAGPRVNEVEAATGHRIASVSASHINHAVAPRFNGGQFHQQNGGNQLHNQTAYNHSNMQPNHIASNNMQRPQEYNRPNTNVSRPNYNQNTSHNNVQGAQPYNRPNTYTSRPNYNGQYQRQYSQNQRPAQQHYSQPSMQSRPSQNYSAQQRSYQRSQPVQRQSQHTFASAQRSSRSGGGGHPGGGGGRGGRR